MKKLKKLVLVTTALAALAVGGAAFAQAQSAGTVAKVSVQQPGMAAEATTPGDLDNVQSGDQSGSDQGQAGEQESGAEQADAPESASESDGPNGHQDESGQSGASHDTETND